MDTVCKHGILVEEGKTVDIFLIKTNIIVSKLSENNVNRGFSFSAKPLFCYA